MPFSFPGFCSCSSMSNTLHAFEFFETDPAKIQSGVIVLFGDENFLKTICLRKIRDAFLSDSTAEVNFSKMDADRTTWMDVRDDLSTVSLFGGDGPRVVCLADADKFVSNYREELERWIPAAVGSGVLIIEVGGWRSNTRIYKALDKSGMQVDCRLPTSRNGKSIDYRGLAKWATHWGKKNYRLKLSLAVIEHLMDLVGPDLGIIDQNLAKLSLYLDEKTAVTIEHIDDYVGGWQVKTVWELVDLALSGKTGEALSLLDRLLQNGDSPNALLGQIGWSLRRVASAFEAATRYSRKGIRQNTNEVLESAGYRYPAEQKKAIQQLKKIGRRKGLQYYRMLLECDLALKSSHSHGSRARIALEKLLFGLVDHHVEIS